MTDIDDTFSVDQKMFMDGYSLLHINLRQLVIQIQRKFYNQMYPNMKDQAL